MPPIAQLLTAQAASLCVLNSPTCRAVMTIGTRLASITIYTKKISITPVIAGAPPGADLDMMCVACHNIGYDPHSILGERVGTQVHVHVQSVTCFMASRPKSLPTSHTHKKYTEVHICLFTVHSSPIASNTIHPNLSQATQLLEQH